MVTVENGGHFLPLDRPYDVMNQIKMFDLANTSS